MKIIIILLTVLLGVSACRKEEPLQTIELQKLKYTGTIINDCSNNYNITSDYFDTSVNSGETISVSFNDTYDESRKFRIYIGGTQYKPIINRKTKTFTIKISLIKPC